MSHSALDLDAYFKRINYTGPRDVSLNTLNDIVSAHIAHIPFENLSVLMGSDIVLDVPSLQKKLVADKRGGYCFEQNRYLMLVLEALGYDVAPLSARVRIGRERTFIPPRTHLFVRVDLNGSVWLVDVGVGGLSPTAAIKLSLDDVQATPHESRRIIREGAIYYHQALLAGQWEDVYEFTMEEMPFIDQEMANWYTSTHPQSSFKEKILVARSAADGVRLTLLNDEFSIRDANGHARKYPIHSKEALIEVLSKQFDLNIALDTPLNLPTIAWL